MTNLGMNTKSNPVCVRWIVITGIVTLSATGMVRAQPRGGPTQPLSFRQVERLVQIQAPDATVAAEIRKRGLDFAPTKATGETLRRLGAGPETLQAIDELRPMLDDAKQAIPAVLTKIYQALDQGNPQAIRPFISPQIAGNSRLLDSICRPFTYRAHYIEAILERPGQQFEVRVRALYKPFDEQARVLTFHPYQGTFLLVQTDGATADWFGVQKEAAVDLARNFIYAAKAQQASVLAGLVAPDLDVSQYTQNACWHEAFQGVNEIRDSSADLDARRGLKIKVHVSALVQGAKAFMYTAEDVSDFWIDRVHDQYKIVAARPLYDHSFSRNAPDACRHLDQSFFASVEAPTLEDDTLKRFGLPASTASTQSVHHCDADAHPPIPTFKPEPAYAQGSHANGAVVLRVLIDENGYVKDVKVVKSLEPRQDDSAVQTVRTWTFSPGTCHGVPVPSQGTIETNFHR